MKTNTVALDAAVLIEHREAVWESVISLVGSMWVLYILRFSERKILFSGFKIKCLQGGLGII